MGEHVGQKNYPTYASVLRRSVGYALRDMGRAASVLTRAAARSQASWCRMRTAADQP